MANLFEKIQLNIYNLRVSKLFDKLMVIENSMWNDDYFL